MKITAIMSSPRIGDSCRIVKLLEERLKKRGDIEFEYVFLKDCDIGMCRGCFLCVRNGEQHCPIRDDVPAVLEKMKQSDGLIFASPVYSLSVTGLMKNFKDRVAYNAHRPSFWGKKAMAVVTTEGTGAKGTLDFIKTWSIWGMEFTSELGINAHPTLTPTESYRKKLDEQIDRAAEAFYKSLKTETRKRPRFLQVVQFRMLKYMAIIAKDGFPADFNFYRDKRDYFYETRVSSIHKLLSGFFVAMISTYMKKNYQLDKLPEQMRNIS